MQRWRIGCITAGQVGLPCSSVARLVDACLMFIGGCRMRWHQHSSWQLRARVLSVLALLATGVDGVKPRACSGPLTKGRPPATAGVCNAILCVSTWVGALLECGALWHGRMYAAATRALAVTGQVTGAASGGQGSWASRSSSLFVHEQSIVLS